MPEIALTVSDLTSFDRAVGDYVAAADWSAGFDHAALVAARRSRPDAKDLTLRHTATGFVRIVAVTGANTADCRVGFNLAASILGSMGDNRYRLGFGDLGKSFQTTTSAGGVGPGVCAVAAAAAPALALPAYGYDLTEIIDYGVRESSALVTRRATLHEYPVQRLRLNYPACDGTTAYTIRAWLESVRGAGLLNIAGFDYRYVPGSLDWEQRTAADYRVALEVESVQL